MKNKSVSSPVMSNPYIQLEHQELYQTQSYINGEWVNASSGKQFEVFNPATGALVALVADGSAKEAEQAIKAAAKALPKWRRLTAKERGGFLRKWFDLVTQHADDLALLMTTEEGKPLAEAKGEVTYGASFIEWFAEEARRVYGDVIPTPMNDRRIITMKQPIGVVAAITPWNFPVAMITRKISPAIAAGCTVVVKPASLTPLCALALAYLAGVAGIPPGVINVVTSKNASEIGTAFTESPLVQKLSFTGSTKVGKILMQQSASTVKKVSLELGGNAPLIVFDDADIDTAVKGALASKYRNAGQTCVCANRLYVQEKIYPAFIKAYKRAVAALKVGNGTEKGIQIGPLIDMDAVKKVKRLLNDAVKKGATISLGGETHENGDLFFSPTVIEGCNHKMSLSKEEIFGPVSAIYKFSTEDDAIRLANDTEYGLAAYFFTNDLSRSIRVAEALDYGIIGINEGVVSHAEAPFGGMKESGIGREGSKYGIEEYLELKYVCVGGVV
jgi:succinate-semialdehyde dehydrogenase / glutarate-semialdehyde dehydrogenase